MKILLDMNLSPEWVEEFEEAGFEAVHWSRVGDIRAEDAEIVDWARQNRALIFSHDLDFSRIVALSGQSSPSILQIRGDDLLPESIGSLVIAALSSHREALREGALMVLDQGTLRLRILPIGP